MQAVRSGFLTAALAALLLLIQGCQQAEQPAAETEVNAPQANATPTPAAKRPASSQTAAKAARPAASSARDQGAGASQPLTATLAAGTAVKVRTTNAISTKTHQAGDTFVATLEEPLVAGNWVIAAKGSTVEGRVTESDPGGRVRGVASMAIALTRVRSAEGGEIDITTNTVAVEAQSTKGKDAAKIAIGAGIGTAIGAIAGGKKGAAVGAATGAGAGTGVVLATRGDAAEIASETVLDFTLRSPVTVTKN